jgi:hypothetical protein
MNCDGREGAAILTQAGEHCFVSSEYSSGDGEISAIAFVALTARRCAKRLRRHQIPLIKLARPLSKLSERRGDG